MDSTLALLLRYLHQVQAACQQATRMFAAAAPPLLQQVVPGTRDTAPLAPEHSSAAGFSESEVQAVMQGAGVGRQAALDAMKRTGGAAVPAFKQELMLLQLCSEQLDVLAWEYASHRWAGGGCADVAGGGCRPALHSRPCLRGTGAGVWCQAISCAWVSCNS
jgi:hypothetical protein